jgi:hypothetical protein
MQIDCTKQVSKHRFWNLTNRECGSRTSVPIRLPSKARAQSDVTELGSSILPTQQTIKPASAIVVNRDIGLNVSASIVASGKDISAILSTELATQIGPSRQWRKQFPPRAFSRDSGSNGQL